MLEEGKDQKTRSQTKHGYSFKYRAFGTSGWIAPEFLNDASHYTSRGDIFPLGLIFAFTLCKGRHPYGEEDTKFDQRDELIKKKQPILGDIALELKGRKDGSFELINQMLATLPEGRPTAKEVLQHAFFFFNIETIDKQMHQSPSSMQNLSSSEHIQEVRSKQNKKKI